VRKHLLLVFFLVVALIAGFLISQYPPAILIWASLAFAVFIISFVKIEWGLYILIFSMLLSPEITIGETVGSSLGRGVTLRFEDFLLIVIGLSWFARNAVDKELGLVLKTPLNKPIFFYILICFLSTGMGILSGRVEVKTGSLFVLKYIEYYVVFFMVANHVKDTDQVKRFIFCILLTCFITSVIGLLQIPQGVRVSAPFEGEGGEPNTLGGYLLFIGSISAGLILKTDNSKLKHLLLLLIIAIIPPLLFTQSRSSYLGILPVCILFGLFVKHRIIVLSLAVVALLLSPFFLPSSVKNRILYTFNQPKASGQIELGELHLDTSTSARIAGLKEILANWPNHPLTGYGITGYMFVDSQLPRILIETGILGLIAFLYLLYSIGKLAINHMKRVNTPYFKGLALGFLAGYVGLLFHSIGANTFIIVRIMEPFWFLTGIIAVLPEIEHREITQAQESSSFKKAHLRRITA
jgi:O-antigen ligase